MSYSIIVAKSENGVIGKDNTLPWHIPVDLLRFKEITSGKTVIMGRKTYESIGQPLPGRRNVVISKTMGDTEGVEVVRSFEEAVNLTKGEKEVFLCGGEDVYRRGLDVSNKIYMTTVDGEFDGDRKFPDINPHDWNVTYWENQADHSFFILERV